MCHSPINALGGSPESKAFQGGLIPMQNWYAPSLTSNKEAGLGDWSIDEIVDLLRTGVSDRGAVYGESRRNPVSDAGARASHDRSGARKTSFFAHMQTSSPRPQINPQTALSIPRLWCFWAKSGTYRTQFRITLATESRFARSRLPCFSERRSASFG